ncbi:MAG: beta-aspartyl-dipeptidase (metallo-type), partial [Gammaproteobacteria bacterium]
MQLSKPLTLIENANLYDPKALGVKSVLIGGGTILAISDVNLHLPSELDVDIVDFSGKTLTPGFIDCHAHITGGGGEAGFSSRVPPVPPSNFSAAGVTTVIGLLGTDDLSRTTAELVSTVYALREQGLSAYCWTGGYHLPLTTLTGSARSDIAFIEPVIGIGEFAISDHRSSQPQFEEIVRLASEAHVAGLMTGKAGIIHFHLGDGDRKLDLIERAVAETEIPSRVFHPTHVNRNKPLFERACKLLASGCYIDLTAFPEGAIEPGLSAAQALSAIHE